MHNPVLKACIAYSSKAELADALQIYLRGVRVALWAFRPRHGPFTEPIRWPVKGNDPASLTATLLGQWLYHIPPTATNPSQLTQQMLPAPWHGLWPAAFSQKLCHGLSSWHANNV